MPNDPSRSSEANRILVKLRPSNALRAAESRVNLRPLYDTPPPSGTTGGFGLDATPQWFVADIPDLPAAAATTPWDFAHARVADQLGVAESDVIYAEPDLIHSVYPDPDEPAPGQPFAVGEDCGAIPPDGGNGKALGPDTFAWHLGDDFTQLGAARDAVEFRDRRTRIGHLDTGYYRAHETVPAHVLTALERSFVDGDANSRSAESPGTGGGLGANPSHGTGTLSILAGGAVSAFGGTVLGGAPGADILPLRIAEGVVLLRTSSLARAIRYAVEQGCDVITLSMGGLPTRVWAEAVDDAYEAGLCFCAAAGNHVSITPPRTLVYPARFSRVIAVCGVMADGRPYAGLTGRAMEGSFGPDSAMKAALATYTPNIPWARFGCKNVVRRNGEGTSAATPQVAAAAALWYEKYKDELPRSWQRVEAVRRALFSTAKLKGDRSHFGNGVLQARAALDVRPVLGLPKSERSDASFGFLRVVTGLGLDEPTPREQMFNLEVAQRWLLNERLQEIVPDPEAASALSGDALRGFMEAVIEDDGASLALRKHVASRYPVAAGRSPVRNELNKVVVAENLAACDAQPALRNPPYRRVRVYAVDPTFSSRLDTAEINEVTLRIRWEQLEKGPTGEYLAVTDVDAA
ncbi:MAG TPA: S8/S53 family peptidase, partial [Thermoanaerobaculia bacterium]|nr:S8/S53 family peptidase [Thermoanaerobaculia bacterium]